MQLTKDQIEFYENNGYLVLRSLVKPDEIVWLREIYDRLFAERAGRERGEQFDLAGPDEEGVEAKLPQILNPSRYAPEIQNGRFQAAAFAIVRQLLGETAEMLGDHAIFKPARTGVETPWHQDEAYWDPQFEYNSLSIWIPLQEATIQNGCMWFVPGSHRSDILIHRSIGNDPRVHGLEIVGRTFPDAVACPISAGDCTVHHNRTIHYTGPNVSDVPRRALILGGGTPPKRLNFERRFPWNEIKVAPRQMREQNAKQSES